MDDIQAQFSAEIVHIAPDRGPQGGLDTRLHISFPPNPVGPNVACTHPGNQPLDQRPTKPIWNTLVQDPELSCAFRIATGAQRQPSLA